MSRILKSEINSHIANLKLYNKLEDCLIEKKKNKFIITLELALDKTTLEIVKMKHQALKIFVENTG